MSTQTLEPLIVRTIDIDYDESPAKALPASFGAVDLTPDRYRPLVAERLDPVAQRRHYSAQASRLEWLKTCRNLTPADMAEAAIARIQSEIEQFLTEMPDLLELGLSDREMKFVRRSITEQLIPEVRLALVKPDKPEPASDSVNMGGRYGGMTGQNKPGASIAEADSPRQTSQRHIAKGKARRA